MRPDLTTPRRETFVSLVLAVLIGGGVFLYFLMIGGLSFVGMLATVSVLALIGLGHYLVWGRRAETATRRGPAGTSFANFWKETPGGRRGPSGSHPLDNGETHHEDH